MEGNSVATQRLQHLHAVTEKSLLSRSQVGQIGAPQISSSFRMKHFHCVQIAREISEAEEEQRVVAGSCDREKEGINNSSKPPGLHLIHCLRWSFETTTNKASSYPGWQGFVWLRCPRRLDSGEGRGYGRVAEMLLSLFLLLLNNRFEFMTDKRNTLFREMIKTKK